MRSMCVGVAETGGLTHMRSMCVGVAETGGINTYAKHVCQFLDDPQRNIKKLFLQCSFRLSEKNEKDKKRKVFLF